MRGRDDTLCFRRSYRDQEGRLHGNGLNDILHGQVWRLVTPIFMHVNILHIFFNMWWLVDLGTLIEVRRGTLRLAVLVLISAIISNFGQYLWMERTDPGVPHLFGGMSGVVYALFGYIWMKGLYQPEQGMILHPNTITIMLLWLVLCMTGCDGPDRQRRALHGAGRRRRLRCAAVLAKPSFDRACLTAWRLVIPRVRGDDIS